MGEARFTGEARRTDVGNPMYVSSLNSRADSLTGGFEIQSARGDCTLGFVSQPIAGNYYAVTASHCSPQFWAPDTATFVQPQGGAAFGWEIADPNGISCNLLCEDYRYSDADQILLYATDTLKVGFLPRPTNRVSGSSGSTSISMNRPGFSGDSIS
jgi:hypothetical protein